MVLKERFLNFLVKSFYNSRFKFDYTFDNFDPKRTDPYILIGNHVGQSDGLYTAVPLKKYPYPVINVFMYTSPFMRFVLKRLIYSIPKRKGQSDISTIKNMMDVIKNKKRGVMLFPEGNSSYFGKESPIPFSTAKFLKKMKLDVVTVHVNGGYLAAPRWTKNYIKGGLFEVCYKTLYTASELEAATIEEVDNAIVEALKFNDFDWNRVHKHKYVSKNRAEGLERYIYACPHCDHVQCLSTKGSVVYCTHCGEIAHFNDYSLIEGVPFDNLVDWAAYQKTRIPYVADKPISSEGELHLVNMDTLKNTDLGQAKVELKDRIWSFKSNKTELHIPIDEIVNLVLIRNYDLAFDYLDKTYYIRIKDPMLLLDVIHYLRKEA